tara:strand:- start:102 stop:551 length:450 start_codon:yes stop_codon:yes gene_type:complete
MKGFNGLLISEFQNVDGKLRWKLINELSYTFDIRLIDASLLDTFMLKEHYDIKDNEVTITALPGFLTDLGSVPRIIWWAISPWDIARSAVIHDLLYADIRSSNLKTKKAARKLADTVFQLAMKDSCPNVSQLHISGCYWATRMFGAAAI